MISPIWFAGHVATVGEHGVCEYASEPSACGVPTPPAKWSPSSTVTTKSVLLLSMPWLASRWKNVANAAS